MALHGFHCFPTHAFDVPEEAHAFEEAYEQPREVELPPTEAMEGTLWKGVMVIVPSFAKADDSNDPIIPTLIGCFEWPFSKRMADRVHAPGNMRREEDADSSSPEKSREAAKEERDEKSKEHPDIDEFVDEHQCAIVEEMGSNDLGVREIVPGEEPSEVSVPKAVEWAMRVSFFIRVCMVNDVGRDPCKGLSLTCPSTCDEEETP